MSASPPPSLPPSVPTTVEPVESAPSTSSAAPVEAAPSTTTEDAPPAVPLSKSAAKRAARQAAFDAGKADRRAKERQHKKEKAAEKRKLVELGLIEKPVTKKSKQSGPKEPYKARIVIDCAFDEKMSDKEIKSMSAQLSFCYSANRVSPKPLDLLITGLSGRLKARLEGTENRPHEAWKGVEWWEEGYEQLWAKPVASASTATEPVEGVAAEESTSAPAPSPPLVSIGTFKNQPRSTSAQSDVIYLTGDSSNVLTEIEEGKTYILGGIVDRNRYKRLCFDKAEQDGIQHAQLPIGQYMPEMPTRKVLTVNQVYEIIVGWVETRDWKEALTKVMPTRKMTDGHKKVKKGAKAANGEEMAEGDSSVYVANEQDTDDDEEVEDLVPEAVVASGEAEPMEVEGEATAEAKVEPVQDEKVEESVVTV